MGNERGLSVYVCVRVSVCVLTFRGNELVQGLYFSVCVPRVCALSLISEGLFGVFCSGFAQGGGGFSESCIQM